jgi:hypothetical protein
MNVETVTFPNGRKYEVMASGELSIIIGPPEGLVDMLGLPEPFATRLHNILHQRGILNYQIAAQRAKELQGAYQEALLVETQALLAAFFQYEKENQEAQHG